MPNQWEGTCRVTSDRRAAPVLAYDVDSDRIRESWCDHRQADGYEHGDRKA